MGPSYKVVGKNKQLTQAHVLLAAVQLVLRHYIGDHSFGFFTNHSIYLWSSASTFAGWLILTWWCDRNLCSYKIKLLLSIRIAFILVVVATFYMGLELK